MKELIDLFDSLKSPTTVNGHALTFSGLQIPTIPFCHICKDTQGNPALLISLDDKLIGYAPANIELENLRIEHSIKCRVSNNDGVVKEGIFSILHCLTKERSLHEYFLLTMGAIITASLPASVSFGELSIAINRLVELFHILTQPPTRPIQGLWAELFVISKAANPLRMIETWHNEIDERFDFSFGSQRLEVKSSGDRTRRHFFTLEQAYPPDGTDVLVASVFVERSTSGASLWELWDNAREIVGSNADLLVKLERICLKALGESWDKARNKCFDYQLAEQTLAFYEMSDIPKVSAELPQGVSEVRFRSDLSLVAQIDTDNYHGTGSFFDALFGDIER